MTSKDHNNNSLDVSRRGFLKTMLYTSPVLMFGPGCLFGEAKITPLYTPKLISPGKKVRVAQVGVFNRGGQILNDFKRLNKQVEYVGFADVLFNDDNPTMKGFDGVPCYVDYREMFEDMHDQFDAVVVCTPDHSHFPAIIHAMLMGKHVYVEKPLAQNVYECRMAEKVARATGVVTQLGNQGHSGSGTFQFGDWVDAGLMKNVKRIDTWMIKSRRWHGWTDTEYPNQIPPVGYDWDQWLCRRPFRPHSDKLTGGNWRCWYEFGCGCMGDWGAHVMDAMHRFLKLGQPYEITTTVNGPSDLYYPQSSVITFKFKARGDMPPVELRWFDGQGNLPPAPAGYEGKMGNVGSLIYTDKNVIRGISHGANYKVIEGEAPANPPALRKNLSGHQHNFINACQGIEPVNSPFEVGAPLSEMLCLGCIGQKFPGTLKYDAKKMKITNNAEANKMLMGPAVRENWDAYDSGKLVKSKKSLMKTPATAKWENLIDSKMSKWENPYEWGIKQVNSNDEVILTTDKSKWFLLTKKEYANFVFEAEIKMPVDAGNSGFMFRCQKKKNKVWGYQTEVDTQPRKWSGGLYDEGRRGWFINPIRGDKESEANFRAQAGECFKQGKWNKYRVECTGSHIVIWVNNIRVTDVHDSWDIAGHIGIQHHGEKDLAYKFRNIRIKDLGAGGEVPYPHREEAAKKAAATGSVKNTLKGDVYEAEDVVLKGGTKIATNQKGYQGKGFADFAGKGSSVEFDNCLAGASGPHKLTFRYANADNRPCDLIINGKKAGTVKFGATGGPDKWKTIESKATLKKGGNSIKLVAIGNGPNLDALGITK